MKRSGEMQEGDLFLVASAVGVRLGSFGGGGGGRPCGGKRSEEGEREKRKEGAQRRFFSRVGERRPPTIPPNAILGRGGGAHCACCVRSYGFGSEPNIPRLQLPRFFAIGGFGFF